MNCIIIEDQPPARRLLTDYVAKVDYLHLLDTFTGATGALTLLRENRVDLMFLDIHLPGVSGLDLLRGIRRPPAVILTTAFPDYALDGYDLQVVDYLLKPISLPRFLRAVERVPRETAQGDTDTRSIFIKAGRDYVRLPVADLCYIRSHADYTELHLVDGNRHISARRLRYWLERLGTAGFQRVHKSYLVQLRHITRLSGNELVLGGGARVPVGRAFKERLLGRML